MLHKYDTAANPRGLCALSPHASNAILAIPGIEPGHVQLVDLGNAKVPPTLIAAHETPLACMSINKDGTLIATASEKGTLIRVFETQTGRKKFEVLQPPSTQVL